jgi:hypothetical protein
MEPYNPYEPPSFVPRADEGARALGSIRVDGRYLIFRRGAFLPNACVKCGARPPTPLVRRWKNYVFVPWYGWFFGILGQLTQRRATVELPLCRPCDARYRSGVRAMWVATGVPVLGVVLINVGVSVDAGVMVGAGLVLFLCGLPLPLIVLVTLFRQRRLPLAAKIDDSEVTLAGVHPRAMEFFIASVPT